MPEDDDNVCPTLWGGGQSNIIYGKSRLIVRADDAVEGANYSAIYGVRLEVRDLSGKLVYKSSTNIDYFHPKSGEVNKIYNLTSFHYPDSGISFKSRRNGGGANKLQYYYRDWDTTGGNDVILPGDAMYKDGEYEVRIVISDYPNGPNRKSHTNEVKYTNVVDNFVPYIKEIEIVDANNVNKLLFRMYGDGGILC